MSANLESLTTQSWENRCEPHGKAELVWNDQPEICCVAGTFNGIPNKWIGGYSTTQRELSPNTFPELKQLQTKELLSGLYPES